MAAHLFIDVTVRGAWVLLQVRGERKVYVLEAVLLDIVFGITLILSLMGLVGFALYDHWRNRWRE